MVMDKLGDSLYYINGLYQNKLSLQCIMQIGVKLVTCLQKMHYLGYVHNDLKPDNVLIGYASTEKPIKNQDQKRPLDKYNIKKISLIDFGLVSKYLDGNGNHIKKEIPDKFKGSLVYASKNAFKEKMLSRRDDLISLVYILIYMLDRDRLPYVSKMGNKELKYQDKMKIVRKDKMKLGPQELCGSDA